MQANEHEHHQRAAACPRPWTLAILRVHHCIAVLLGRNSNLMEVEVSRWMGKWGDGKRPRIKLEEKSPNSPPLTASDCPPPPTRGAAGRGRKSVLRKCKFMPS
ncbi:hypothetical protein EVAR_32698_1 [Eumeta japonica]|uniref:Uncharacterized protein n=1 Tax=Eumeta variegata TaxID=151549 RepID=A0A4C1VS67_EUMVA|nr:hypothetical protein EVAR_32698_1 [Eumeta japonica]